MLRKLQTGTLRCGNQVIDLSVPRVMGIINTTPDSFYSQSRTGNNVDVAIDLAGKMLEEGATILDVGGMSTRPGAEEVPVEIESERVIPVIEAILRAYPGTIISVDTYRAGVAEKACQAGATMINDISGGRIERDIWRVAMEYHASYVLMHSRGTPADMQLQTDYQDIINDLLKYFVELVGQARKLGLRDIVIDPGFGFAKTMEQNYKLIQRLDVFRLLELPVLIGVSRKSTLSKSIGRPAEETLQATTALHMAALINGASILRVHDVRPAMDAVVVYQNLVYQENSQD